MSTQRRQVTVSGSIPSLLPCRRCASRSAARRLFAAPIAWMSPVKWRFMSSIGTTCAKPPPAAPPLIPNTGPERRLAEAEHRVLANCPEPLRQRDGGGRLPLAGLGRRDRRDVDELRVGLVCEPVEDGQVDLGLVLAVRVVLVLGEAHGLCDLRDRPELGLLGDLEGRLHLRGHSAPPVRGPDESGPYIISCRGFVGANACVARAGRGQCETAAAASSETIVSV